MIINITIQYYNVNKGFLMTCQKNFFFYFYFFPFSVINAANANQHCPQEFDSIDCLKLLNSQYPLNYNKLLERRNSIKYKSHSI